MEVEVYQQSWDAFLDAYKELLDERNQLKAIVDKRKAAAEKAAETRRKKKNGEGKSGSSAIDENRSSA